MAGYNQAIARTSTNGDPLVPDPVVADVIKQLPQASAVLSVARRVPMSAKTNRQPVLSALPEAYFVNGDTGRKQTDKVVWDNVSLVAEEIAVIVPVPEAYLDDSAIPIWSEVQPLITEAFGRKIDRAALFGIDKPATWGDAVVVGAAAAGNIVLEGTGDDLAEEVAQLGQELDEDGFETTGFVSSAGLRWRLRRLRDSDGSPIYSHPADGGPATLYGLPLGESRNGGFDPEIATVIAGDWSKAIVGIRQDITFKVFTEGVISDDSGQVVLNLMQQDSVALRAVMRVAWAVANPVTPLNDDDDSRFPFAALVPASSQYS